MGRGLSAESYRLIARAHAVLETENPSGVRRVAYALFGNQADSVVKKLGKQLSNARRRDLIPWEWISDDTRPSIRPFVVEDMNDLRQINAACPDYDPWPSQHKRVVLWSEKSLGGTLKPILEAYKVEFQVHHGNSSWSEFHKYAKWTQRHPHLRFVILYVGDHDPKGLRISGDDIPKRMRDRGAINWEINRVAILRPDVEAVPTTHRDAFKEKDTDIRWYRAHTGLSYGVEVETLPSNVLRDRVEAAIQREIVDVGAWNRVMDASEVVRESWEAYVHAWPIPPLGSE